MSVQQEARRMIREDGAAPVPIEAGSKRPNARGWQNLRLTEPDVRTYFANGGGVGVLLGAASNGLIDVDLDAPEAVTVARSLLPQTERIHGRESNPDSHYWYRCNPEPKKGIAFRDPTIANKEEATLVEIRSNGQQTVVPPSRHPSGETLRWVSRGEPAVIDAEALRAAVAILAAAALLARHWPEGARHDAAFALAGALIRGGWAEERAEAFVAAVVEAAGDDEPDDRIRQVREAASKLASGANVTGWRTLSEFFDTRLVGRLQKWLGLDTARPLGLDEIAETTDSGNALRLADLHGERLRYVPAWKKWLAWDHNRWRIDVGNMIVGELAGDIGRALLREAADANDRDRSKRLAEWGKQSLSASRIRAAIELARKRAISVNHEQLDSDPWLLGVRNGVIDLRTGERRDADPADMMTMQAPVTWSDDAEAPRWERALVEWFSDESVRSYVQRLTGAALIGKQRDHVFVIHFGAGRNGKGTFIRALMHMLGPYAVVPHLSMLVQTNQREHDTIKAHLFRARLAVASETQRRVRLDEASVKNLTGGDRISARRMHEDVWEFDPTHSLWLQTNHLPQIEGRDHGIWSRIRVVPWGATFERGESDLDEKLEREVAGVLRWAVAGCLEYQRDGLVEPEAVVRATLAYRGAEDVFARFAADVGLKFGRGSSLTTGALRNLLDDWQASEGVDMSVRDVNEWLRTNGAVRRRRRSGDKLLYTWHGVGVVTDGGPGEASDDDPDF